MQGIQKIQDLEKEGVIRSDTNLKRNGVTISTEIERDKEYKIAEVMTVLKDDIGLAEKNKSFKTGLNRKLKKYSEICKEVMFKEVRSPENISGLEASVENFRGEVAEDNLGSPVDIVIENLLNKEDISCRIIEVIKSTEQQLAERSDQSHDTAENLFIVEIDTHVGEGSPHKSIEDVLATKNHVGKGSPHESFEDVLETIFHVGERSPHELVIEEEIEEVLSNEVNDNVEVAGVSAENRNFLTVNLEGCDYRALYDSGSTLSLVSKKIAKKFLDRLEPVRTHIE